MSLHGLLTGTGDGVRHAGEHGERDEENACAGAASNEDCLLFGGVVDKFLIGVEVQGRGRSGVVRGS